MEAADKLHLAVQTRHILPLHFEVYHILDRLLAIYTNAIDLRFLKNVKTCVPVGDLSELLHDDVIVTRVNLLHLLFTIHNYFYFVLIIIRLSLLFMPFSDRFFEEVAHVLVFLAAFTVSIES